MKPVPGIRSPRHGIWNPKLSRIILHVAKSESLALESNDKSGIYFAPEHSHIYYHATRIQRSSVPLLVADTKIEWKNGQIRCFVSENFGKPGEFNYQEDKNVTRHEIL